MRFHPLLPLLWLSLFSYVFSENGVTLHVFDNTALAGKPSETHTLPTVEFSLPAASSLSAELTGVFQMDEDINYKFNCYFGSASIGFFWVDDHLVCQMGAFSERGKVNSVDNPLRVLSKKALPLRMHVYYFADQINGTDSDTLSVNVTVSKTKLNAVDQTHKKYSYTTIISPYFEWNGINIDTAGRTMKDVGGDISGTLTECKAKCEELASKGCVAFVRPRAVLDKGSCFMRKLLNAKDTCEAGMQPGMFNTWTRNASCHIVPPFPPTMPPTPVPPTPGPLDPSKLSPTLSIPDQQRMTFQKQLISGWAPWIHNNVLALAKLPEGIVITTALCRASTKQCLTTSTIDKTRIVRVGAHAIDRSYMQLYVAWNGLNVSFEYSGGAELHLTATNCSMYADWAVVFFARNAWGRQSKIQVNDASITFDPVGNIDATTMFASPSTAIKKNFPLPDDLNSVPHLALSLASGDAGKVGLSSKAVMSTADLTTLINAAKKTEYARYAKFGNLSETKMAVQAATMWNLIFNPVENGPLAPVARGWDFTSGKQNDDWGYVIFDWDNIFASYMMALDQDAKLFAYSNFIQVIKSKTNNGFVPNFAAAQRKSDDRTEPPIGSKVLLEIFKRYGDKWLVELLFDDLLDWSNWFIQKRFLPPLNLIALGGNGMQGARYESGLDNSPMYDGNFYNGSTKLMLLYDVGMSSMFTMEADALAELAIAINRPEANMLKNRASSMRKNIASHMWDSQGGIFTNLFPNNTFYRRISPTSFYAMLANASTDKQAEQMATQWLLNKEKFCLTPNGDMSGNTKDCWWGLPSINAADPAFPAQGYWRGYVWGPMSQLTWWSLKTYEHVPAITVARKALCKQMTAMMLNQWRLHRHICENFSPHQSNNDCTGDTFYHWGGLTGLISLLEAGY